jgi:DNA N-6-adenine-methyltransferase (Dam).
VVIVTRTNNTSLKDVWQTPDEVLTMLGEIDLDPCAGLDTNHGETNFRNITHDGLESDWFGRVFVNPPFSEKSAWLEKSIEERENTECIFVLTPDSTDTISWWHEYIASEADYIWFSEGRISYVVPEERAHLFDDHEGGEKAGSPTFGTAISVFGEPGDDTLERMNENGQLLETYRP